MGRRCLLLTPEGAGCSMLLLPPFSPCPNIFLHISHEPSRSLCCPRSPWPRSARQVCISLSAGRGRRGLAGSGAATAFIPVQALCSGSLT